MATIELKNVHKKFECGSTLDLLFSPLEVQALKGISLEHPPGECLYLTGPSGSGKSVLMNLIAGYYAPDRGKVRVFGMDPEQSSDCRSRISLVRPGPRNFDAALSPRKNLEVTAGFYDIPVEEQSDRVQEALEFVGIQEPEQQLPYGELAPGTKNLISIAAGLINSPDLLLMDSPERYLDHSGTEKIRGLLKGLLKEGTTLVVATRDSTIVEPLQCRHVELREGTMHDINATAEVD